MKEIKAYIRRIRLQKVLDTLHAYPQLPGVTCSEVTGFGRTRSTETPDTVCSSMTKLEMVVPEEQVREVVDVLLESARTGDGRTGDGMIFISSVEKAVRIRTGLSEGP